MTSQNDPSFKMQPIMPPQDNEAAISDLAARMASVEQRLYGRINLNTDIFGLFETVSTAPTKTPTSPYEQIKIYVNGVTYRLYWYDGNGNVWHYVTATA